MTKLLILFLLGWLVWRALRPAAPRRAPPGAAARTPEGERMRACAHCGLNVPESESLHDGAFDYCCAEHLRLGVGAHTREDVREGSRL